MRSKIKIFESGISDGIMSRNKKFYPEGTPQEEINNQFLEIRKRLGKKHGFNGKKIFQASQKTDTNGIEYENGTYHVITDSDIDNDDLWYVKLPADILIISSKYKNIVIGNQMADCPVLIIEDRKLGVTALSHCGAPYINRKLPSQTVEALIKSCNSDPKDLYAYIGSCAKKENYIYDRYPTWATNKEVWENAIKEQNNQYYIDLVTVITDQLTKGGVEHIDISPNDTIISPKFYSHNASSKGNKAKLGQNFVGFFYK